MRKCSFLDLTFNLIFMELQESQRVWRIHEHFETFSRSTPAAKLCDTKLNIRHSILAPIQASRRARNPSDSPEE